MRIGFLTTQWPGARLGGIGVYTLQCAKALAAAGHEPHVFTLALPPDVRSAIPAGIVVHEVADLASRVDSGALPGPLAAGIHAGGEGIYRLALGSLLCDAVRRVHAVTPLDILEGPEYEALALPLLLNPIANLGVVTHLHSGSAIRRLGNGEVADADQLLLESLEFATILAADGLCAPSNAVVEATRPLCPLASPVEVIGLPFTTDARATFAPPPFDGPILYVGRLEQLKGMSVLAAALNPFLHRCRDARVRLVGPDTSTAPGGGSMAAWMRGRIDPAFAHRVSFAGELNAAELAHEYNNAAFCVIPSLSESYSFVACEAMAAGRTAIVSSGIGAAEVVGDAGITFPRGDAPALAAAMIGCFKNPDRVQELSRQAFDRARQTLSAEATLPRRIAFYQATIAAFKNHGHAPSMDTLARLPSGHAAGLVHGVCRLTGYLAGIADATNPTPGSRLLTIMRRVAGSGGHAPILLYGAGRHTARLLAEKHLWEAQGHRVIGLIDDHPRFVESPTAWGLPVESCAKLASRLPLAETQVAVVLSTDTFQEPFWQQAEPLRAKGMRVFKLYES